MTSESNRCERELLERLLVLNGMVNEIEQGVIAVPSQASRDGGFGRRLLIPGQILRFPSKEGFEEFKTQYIIDDNDIEILDNEDPLGFDGGIGKVIPPRNNSKNYLQREQLPPLRIDMKNIYNPSYNLSSNGRIIANFVPFINSKGESTFPQILTGQRSLVQLVTPRQVGFERILSSYVPRIYTYDEFYSRMSSALEGVKSGQLPKSTNVCFAITRSGTEIVSAWNIVGSPGEGYEVPQTVDCSSPKVGFFCFNQSHQNRLPQDPMVRVGVIIRIKKYLVV